MSVTKICGTLDRLAWGEQREWKAIAPWVIIDRLIHRCAKGGRR
jgi:hypothetical protein